VSGSEHDDEKEEKMATEKNLKDAFAGESQANRMYLAFAQKAESEGYPQIGKLFRAAAAAETVHAHAHFRVMGGVKDTAGNLQTAINGEGYECREMYPAFLSEAETEKNAAAAVSFRNALAVEKIHFSLYSEAMASLKKGKDLAKQDIFVCEVCGNTVYGYAPDKCPICGAPKTKFTKVQ
jgi:rubrerythrin